MNVVSINSVREQDYAEYDKVAEAQIIRPASDFVRRMLDEMAGVVERPRAIAMQFGVLGGRFALRPSEVTVWTGYAGHGKSMLLGETILTTMAQGERCLVISPEFAPQRVVERMVCQSAVREAIDDVPLSFAREWGRWAHSHLWLLEQRGLLTPDRVVGAIRYAYDQHGVSQVVIDSLMMCGIAEDDNERMRPFMDRLHSVAVQYGLHLHLVAHARKREDDSRIPALHDIKGVSTIGDMAENVVAVWRNKAKKPDEVDKPDGILSVDKQRNGNWTGKVGLWFHPSGRYTTKSGARPAAIEPWNNTSEEF